MCSIVGSGSISTTGTVCIWMQKQGGFRNMRHYRYWENNFRCTLLFCCWWHLAGFVYTGSKIFLCYCNATNSDSSFTRNIWNSFRGFCCVQNIPSSETKKNKNKIVYHHNYSGTECARVHLGYTTYNSEVYLVLWQSFNLLHQNRINVDTGINIHI